MSTPAPTNQNDPKSDANDSAATLDFEQKLHDFWQKNARAIYAMCAVIALAIVGKGAVDLYGKWKIEQVSSAYRLATTDEKLRAFATANPGQPLAGAALLRLADDAYFIGNYTQAATDYKAAVGDLKDGPLAGRARLGMAMSRLLGGQAAEGEAQLKLIINDSSLLKTLRAEAAYQLASSEAQAGRTDEALKDLDQVNAFEPSGAWAQRAMMLRIQLSPNAAAPIAKP